MDVSIPSLRSIERISLVEAAADLRDRRPRRARDRRHPAGTIALPRPLHPARPASSDEGRAALRRLPAAGRLVGLVPFLALGRAARGRGVWIFFALGTPTRTSCRATRRAGCPRVVRRVLNRTGAGHGRVLAANRRVAILGGRLSLFPSSALAAAAAQATCRRATSSPSMGSAPRCRSSRCSSSATPWGPPGNAAADCLTIAGLVVFFAILVVVGRWIRKRGQHAAAAQVVQMRAAPEHGELREAILERCGHASRPVTGQLSPVRIETRRGHASMDRASEVLGEAFADYPWTRWTVDPEDHLRRVTALQRLALQHYGLPFGQVWVSAVDGVVHSVAVWMDSAVHVPARSMSSYVRAWSHSRVRATMRRSQPSAASGLATGTAPLPPRRGRNDARMQGRGLARAALAPVLTVADDEASAPCSRRRPRRCRVLLAARL